MQATRGRPWDSLEDRLFAKLQPTSTGCIEFMGGRFRLMGYGKICLGDRANRRAYRTHRVAWEINHGPIPDGLFVLHTCDNPPCCSPDHLYLGTKADNMRDMSRRGRSRNGKKTHCVNGHEFTPENTVPRPLATSGKVGRRCRTCRDDEARSRRRRNVAARRFAA